MTWDKEQYFYMQEMHVAYHKDNNASNVDFLSMTFLWRYTFRDRELYFSLIANPRESEYGVAKYVWKKLPEICDEKCYLAFNTVKLLPNMCDNHQVSRIL